MFGSLPAQLQQCLNGFQFLRFVEMMFNTFQGHKGSTCAAPASKQQQPVFSPHSSSIAPRRAALLVLLIIVGILTA